MKILKHRNGMSEATNNQYLHGCGYNEPCGCDHGDFDPPIVSCGCDD